MANKGDYKLLNTKWANSAHRVGSPELDALIEVVSLSGITREEISIADGDFYSATITDLDLPAGSILYRVIEVGSKYIILEGISVAVSYTGIVDGNYTTELKLYADNSNQNDFNYTGGDVRQVGVPLNLDFVNQDPIAVFLFDPIVTGLTGTEDFTLYSSDFYRETQGTRESLSGKDSKFFEDGRKIILSPNQNYLFTFITGGDANGDADVRTQLHFTEKDDPNDV